MMQPNECQNIGEVREAIDTIDHQIIELLGKRAGYVVKASEFKNSPTEVVAIDRKKAMLAKRREWAVEVGLEPDVIEKMYILLVEYFTNAELAHWRKPEEAEK